DARPSARRAARAERARRAGRRCGVRASGGRRDARALRRRAGAHRARPLPGQRRGRERAAVSARVPLTPRQVAILTQLIDAYIATGHPVGSKTLVELGAVEASSSTVRYELAELEQRGLLDHPHTSAGRVPTDLGYRYYADLLLHSPMPPAPLPVDLSAAQREIDAALRTTAET